MNLIVILVLCVLATTKVTLQGFFAKKNIQSFPDGVFFNGLIFLFSALIFFKNAFDCEWGIILFGSVFGFLTVLFQLYYIKAMSCGNVSLTVLIVNLSMIIPLTVSVLAYNEPLSILSFLGILLTVVAFTLNVEKETCTKTKKWFFLCFLASITNGALAVCQQIFGESKWKSETYSFVSWSYIAATILSALLFLIIRAKGNRITFKIKPSVFGFGLCIGIILGVFQVINTAAISAIDATTLFPTYNGGTLILSTISSVFLLKDSLKIKQKFSIFIGIVAIILINI